MPAPVAQVEGREDVSDDRGHRNGEADVEAEECQQRQRDPRADLEHSELIRPQLQVGAREVASESVGVGTGDPHRGAGGLEAPAQLLADVSQRPIGDARTDAGLDSRLAIAGDDPVDDESHPKGCANRDDDRYGRHWLRES
ncbi:MAG: hypothetical protein E6I77_02425 [Chloroflexi bacterium]|nr:MAG: hypothetical protein E6I77_02425 [Chloroflexota bacterium]